MIRGASGVVRSAKKMLRFTQTHTNSNQNIWGSVFWFSWVECVRFNATHVIRRQTKPSLREHVMSLLVRRRVEPFLLVIFCGLMMGLVTVKPSLLLALLCTYCRPSLLVASTVLLKVALFWALLFISA